MKEPSQHGCIHRTYTNHTRFCEGVVSRTKSEKYWSIYSYPRIMFFPLKKALGCHREQSYHAIKGTVKYQSLIR